MSTTKSHPLAEIKECPEKPWGMLHLMGRAGLGRQGQGCGVVWEVGGRGSDAAGGVPGWWGPGGC